MKAKRYFNQIAGKMLADQQDGIQQPDNVYVQEMATGMVSDMVKEFLSLPEEERTEKQMLAMLRSQNQKWNSIGQKLKEQFGREVLSWNGLYLYVVALAHYIYNPESTNAGLLDITLD